MLDVCQVAAPAASPTYSLDRGPHAEIQFGRHLTVQIAAAFCRAVAAHVRGGVASLDLHLLDVERIDSIGLAALHQVAMFTAARGVVLSLVPSPALYRALLDAQLLEEFTLIAPPPGRPRMSRRLPESTMASGPIIATGTNLALRLPAREDLSHFDGWACNSLLTHMVGSDLLYRCRHLGSGHPEVAGLILDNPSSLTVLVEPLGTRGEPVGFLRLYGIGLASSIAFLETAVASPHARRRGWGVEASRLLVAYAMDALGIRRIEAKVFAYNTPSINALSRNNFQQEGVLRDACLHDGRRCDIVVFSILEDEMRHQRQGEHYSYMGFWEPLAA